ncbi:barstar family protein [Jatrophihabitans endophyticus]|uniref:barstar family protein n=1 Tax=Jatrophihabitans endophyticus TaxID=1206085 RepID=UPI001A105BE8|nr:barstar family protein [Jatrophihabitans endophyticus]MBE7188342.1 barstar family protein [Jatrophihabitans endophyticus]
MSGLADAIALLYAQVRAPVWAARNLDALADVLRDLSWLPAGPVLLHVPDLAGLPPGESVRLTSVLRDVATETARGAHPLHVIG